MVAQFAALAPTIFEKLGKKFEKAEERIAGSLNKASNLGPSIAPPLTLSGANPNSQNIVNAGFSTQAADVSQGIIQSLGIQELLKTLLTNEKTEIKDTPIIEGTADIKTTPGIEKPDKIKAAFATQTPELKEQPIKTSEKPVAAKTVKKEANSSPTQQTNTPVREATKSREEGRTRFEQLFLDLVNGELNIKF